MLLEFIGADHEVTGSCHYIKVGDKNILIDCGMKQGREYYKNVDLPVSPSNLDCVFLTHAHIDHSGMLPKLYADGYRGPIICTPATRELCEILLLDCAHIQAQEAQYRSKKSKQTGNEETESAAATPIYTMEEAQAVMRLFKTYPYGEKVKLCDEITFRMTDIGHLLGSASIELWLSENGEERKIVFSGDIGNKNQPLLRDPAKTAEADYVVMESTYGDRLHEKMKGNYVDQLANAIADTLDRGGNLVIPAFAVGRTQVLLYFIRQIKENNLIPENPNFPVYVDSPMAVRAISVFEDCEGGCYDEEAMAILKEGKNPISFPNLHLSITTDESIAINTDATPKVIISASGMCDAGRIRHHLKHNLSSPKNTILFVGYQAEGTLGRRLEDGVEKVRLFGEDIKVQAKIMTMDGMSGHADRDGLLEWIHGFTNPPKQTFVVHGEDLVATGFAELLKEQHGIPAMAPFSGTKYDLLGGRFVAIAKGVPIEKGRAERARSVSDSYTKLMIAKERLLQVLEESRGLPNKELDRFTKEINDLCRTYQIPKE